MTPTTSYRTIPLTKGQFTTVDVRDYEWLSQWDWYALWSKCTRSFYAVRTEKRMSILMHREILGLVFRDGRLGDHRNLDTLDNRRSNLRIATHSGNNLNSHLRKDNTSGTKGVYFYPERNKWYVRISVGGRTVSLGYFFNKEDAIAARLAAAKKHYGEFGREQ